MLTRARQANQNAARDGFTTGTSSKCPADRFSATSEQSAQLTGTKDRLYEHDEVNGSIAARPAVAPGRSARRQMQRDQQRLFAVPARLHLLLVRRHRVYSTCTAATNSTTYCRSDDSVCAACSVSASKPTCTGEDGSCVCRSLCSVVTSSSKRCTSNSQSFSMMYVAVAFGALSIMLMLYMQRKCAEKRARARMSLVQRELEARRQQRQREREMLRARRPELALELAAWRDHVELHKPQISNVELETCYYLMLQEKKNELGDGLSDDELKAGGIGAVGSPRYADGHTPYFAMREEYPSNTTTHCADDDSDGELEEHAEIAINVNDADRRPVSK